MRQSFILKVFLLALFIICSQSNFAQTSTQTNCKSSTNVQVNMSKNQKLSLTDNDASFDLSLHFKKEYTQDVRKMLTQELGRSNSDKAKKQIWSSSNGAYTFELKDGYIYVNIIKNKLETTEYEALKNVGSATLELAGFNVNVDGINGKFDIHID